MIIELSEEEFNPKITERVVMLIRLRRMTKRLLVERFKKGGGRMSPEIGTEVREGADDVKLNIPYEIVNVETNVTTDVAQYSGVRVEMVSPKGHIGNIMLWKRPVTGTGSKLGVFIILLGTNTDKWLHKWIIFTGWDKGNRKVEIIPKPTEASTKATTGKGVQAAVKKAVAKK